MTILAIDPGLRRTGWACIRFVNRRIDSYFYGMIAPKPQMSLSQRLFFLFKAINELIETHKPKECVLEKTLIGMGKESSLRLSHARTIPLLAAGIHNMSLYEYAPTQVKKTVTGYGKASKEQMIAFIKKYLQLKDDLRHDQADAFALALTHAYVMKLL